MLLAVFVLAGLRRKPLPHASSKQFRDRGWSPPDIPKGHVPHPTIGPVCFAVLKNLRKRSCYGRFQFRANRVLVVCAEFFHNLHTSSDHTLRGASLENNIGLDLPPQQRASSRKPLPLRLHSPDHPPQPLPHPPAILTHSHARIHRRKHRSI